MTQALHTQAARYGQYLVQIDQPFGFRLDALCLKNSSTLAQLTERPGPPPAAARKKRNVKTCGRTRYTVPIRLEK
jgi:hypothetical protein